LRKRRTGTEKHVSDPRIYSSILPLLNKTFANRHNNKIKKSEISVSPEYAIMREVQNSKKKKLQDSHSDMGYSYFSVIVSHCKCNIDIVIH